MNSQWPTRHRSAAQRQRADYHQRLRTLRTHQRLDRTLITLTLLLSVVIGGGWLALAELNRRAVTFSEPLQPIPDDRILTNLRQHSPERAFLDAIAHQGELVVSQQGRTFHLYNPQTQLWRTLTPFSADDPIAADFVQLGDTNATLWALGDDGSLVSHDDAQGWRIRIGSTAFLGRDGQPVPPESLTSAAISPDGTWLALGTAGYGLGLYNRQRRAWLPPLVDSPPVIEHLAVLNGAFYLGTPEGLYRLSVTAPTAPEIVSAFTGAIVDLASDASHLYALERDACPDGGTGCLRLLRLSASGQVSLLMDERHNDPQRNLDELHFAQSWGERVVMAGQSGIASYDTPSHTWTPLENRPVSLTRPLPDGNGFYYGAPRALGFVQPGFDAQTWDLLANQTLSALQLAPDNTPLALTTDGTLYTLSPDGLQTLREAPGTETDPATFGALLQAGDAFLFAHPAGATLHDAVTRRYHDIEPRNLPDWFSAPGANLSSGETAFALRAFADRTEIYPLPADLLRDPASYQARMLHRLEPSVIPGAGTVPAAWPWDGVPDEIGVLASDGGVFRVNAQGLARVTGGALDSLRGASLVDAVPATDAVLFADASRLLRYDLIKREWQMGSPIVSQGETLREVLLYNDQAYAVTANGRLLDADGASLIEPTRFNVTDASLSDAWRAGEGLILAGAGGAEAYDLQQRRVTQRWQPFAPGAPVSLRGVVDGVPLMQAGTSAAYGDVLLGDEVRTLSHDGTFAWSVRQTPTHRYLLGQRLDNSRQTRCFFRQPTLTGTLRDVARLPNGEIAALTDAGLRFYRPEARTWVEATFSPFQPQRLFVLGDSLLLTRPDAFAVLPANGFAWPDTCDTAPLTVLPAQQNAVRALSVDPANNRFAWINADGSVQQWQNGTLTQILAAPGSPPAPNLIRRLYDRQNDGYLLALTGAEVWHYDLNRRTWTNVPLSVPGGQTLVDLSAAFNGARVTLTGRASNGQTLRVAFDGLPPRLTLQTIQGPTTPAPVPLENLAFNLGEARFALDASGLSVTLNAQPALNAEGFLWDRNRRALRYREGALWLASDAGLHPVDAYGPFAANASFAAPTLPAGVLIDDARWTWTRSNGQIDVTLKGASQQFALTPTGFTSDRLREAAAVGAQLVISTDAYLEAGDLSAIEDGTAPRQAPLNAQNWRIATLDGPSRQLLADFADGPRAWNGQTFAPVNPSAWPTLATTDRLRFLRDNGSLRKEIRLDAANGSSSWVPFAFNGGRLPFDVVNSAAVHNGALYIGTNAGLQVLTGNDVSLSAAATLLDFRSDPSGAPAPVTRLGNPLNAPGNFLARGPQACFQALSATSFTPCAEPAQLDTLLRFENAFWRWTRDATLTGRYRLADGTLDAGNVTLVDGAFPHDATLSATACQGATPTLWAHAGQNFITHTATPLSVNSGARTFAFGALSRFVCVNDDPGALPDGLYVTGASTLRYDGSNWQPISDAATAQAIADYRPARYQRERLRYVRDGFEVRDVSDNWRALAWQQDPFTERWRLPLDDWRQVISLGDQLWAATGAGWLDLQRDADNTLSLDPANLRLIPTPDPTTCRITDVMSAGENLITRCNHDSARVTSGPLTGPRTPLSVDPFAEQTLLDDELWQWRRTGRVNGQRGRLAITWKATGETITLSNGRFPWDTLTSFALFEPGVLDVATATGGWFTAPRDTFRLAEIGRSSAAAGLPAVDAVQIGEAGLLCLRALDGDYLRLNAERLPQDRVAACPEALASTSLWQYARAEDGLTIRSAEGAQRTLQDGRFTDDIAVGLPERLNEQTAVPTAAGVVVWDSAGEALSISGGDFEGLPPETPPSGLIALDGDWLYLGAEGLYALDGSGLQVALDLTGLSPLETSLISETNGLLTLECLYRKCTYGISTFDRFSGERQDDGLTLDVRALPVYTRNSLAWGEPAPTLILQFLPSLPESIESIEARFAGRALRLASVPGWRVAFRLGDAVMVLRDDEVLTLKLDALLPDIIERGGVYRGPAAP